MPHICEIWWENMHSVTCYVSCTVERMNEMVASEPLGSFRNRIYCQFYTNSSQTLSIHGLPPGRKHALHLIHSSWLIIWEKNLTWWDAEGGTINYQLRSEQKPRSIEYLKHDYNRDTTSQTSQRIQRDHKCIVGNSICWPPGLTSLIGNLYSYDNQDGRKLNN